MHRAQMVLLQLLLLLLLLGLSTEEEGGAEGEGGEGGEDGGAEEVAPQSSESRYDLQCFRGRGELLPTTSGLVDGLTFPSDEFTQAWLDDYLSRNPHLAGPTVYDPFLPPRIEFVRPSSLAPRAAARLCLLCFSSGSSRSSRLCQPFAQDFGRGQPPDNDTLAAFVLDGTGINHSAVEVTAVEQLALGRIRLSGVPSDFAPGSVGERALKDFLFDLGGQAGSVACDANITRIATTLGADRPVIYVDNVGVSHYEQTVDLQFQVRHAANFFDVYRSTAFSNALFRINAARGYGINSTAYMLGQPVRRRPPSPSHRSFIPPKTSAETSAFRATGCGRRASRWRARRTGSRRCPTSARPWPTASR